MNYKEADSDSDDELFPFLVSDNDGSESSSDSSSSDESEDDEYYDALRLCMLCSFARHYLTGISSVHL